MVDPTPKALARFAAWMYEQGLSEGTVALYVKNVRTCHRHPRGPTARLLDRGLAPKTLHSNRAALRQWAKFLEDDQLLGQLARIRLPQAARAKAKVELSEDDWRTLLGAIRQTQMPPAIFAVLLIVGRRGLRISDALRLQRREVRDALRSGTLSYEVKGRRRLEYDAAPVREALEILDEHRGEWERVEDLVVGADCRSRGKGRRDAAARKVSRALARCARAAAIEGVHPHRLRRTYSTHFLRRIQGDPQAIIKLQRHMGWASMATAAQYVDNVGKAELDAIGAQMLADLER